jgi:hypothetical protein
MTASLMVGAQIQNSRETAQPRRASPKLFVGQTSRSTNVFGLGTRTYPMILSANSCLYSNRVAQARAKSRHLAVVDFEIQVVGIGTGRLVELGHGILGRCAHLSCRPGSGVCGDLCRLRLPAWRVSVAMADCRLVAFDVVVLHRYHARNASCQSPDRHRLPMTRDHTHNPDPNVIAHRIVAKSTKDVPADSEAAWAEWPAGVQNVDVCADD